MTRWITTLAAIAICPLLNAQSLMVTNTDDAGAGSLRDAITQAEANPGPDVIEFDIGTDDPIELSTMDLSRGYGKTALVINSELLIDATSSGHAVTITLAAGEEMRLFGIGPDALVEMRGLTLSGGIARGGDGGAGVNTFISGGGGAGMGGAIYLYQGALQLADVSLIDNQATGGAGDVTNAGSNSNGGGGGGSSSFNGGNFTGGTNAGAGGGGIAGHAPNSNSGPGGANQEGTQASGSTSGTLGGGGGGSGGSNGGDGTDASDGGFGGGGGGTYGFGAISGGAGGFGAGGGANGAAGGAGGPGGFGGGGGGAAGSPGNPGAGGFGGGNGAAAANLHGGGGAGMGGAIFNHAGTLLVVDTSLVGNTATGGTGGNDGQGLGGAVFSRNGLTLLSGYNASSNAASNAGDDLFVVADDGDAFYGATPLSGSADVSTTAINGGEVFDILEFDHQYLAIEDFPLFINADEGLLTIDAPLLDLWPDIQIVPFTGSTTNNGEIELFADGSFLYMPAPDFNGMDSFEFQLEAGGFILGSNSVDIDVLAVNDPPVLTLPDSQYASMHGVLVVSVANGNAISVFDVDADPHELTMTLELTGGTIELASMDEVHVVSGGNGQSMIAFDATQDNMNVALDGLVLTLPAGEPGELSVHVSDNGHTGIGDIGTDSGSISITTIPDEIFSDRFAAKD